MAESVGVTQFFKILKSAIRIGEGNLFLKKKIHNEKTQIAANKIIAQFFLFFVYFVGRKKLFKTPWWIS